MLSGFLFFGFFTIIAQNTIPNGGFENWVSSSYDNLDNFTTPIGESIFILGSATTLKSTDSQSGNFSVRLETKTNGLDTMFGFFTTGEFGQSNGFPYNQRPDSIHGFFKCNVKAGDTAVFYSSIHQCWKSIKCSILHFYWNSTELAKLCIPH